MKFNFIALLVSSTVFLAALGARQTWGVGASAHGRYYMTAILMISCIMSVITLFRWLRWRRPRSASASDADREVAERPRQHYRIQFDQPPHPLFVERSDAHDSVSAFTCPVRDISETGISLGCRGVYTHGQTIQGEIIFSSGRTTPVNGVVIREDRDRTCLRLHCSIAPPLLMAEQRDQIVLRKGNRPRPVVSQNVLDTTDGSLPSHSPKGICRLKRP